LAAARSFDTLLNAEIGCAKKSYSAALLALLGPSMNPPETVTPPARPTLAAIADVFVRYANFTLGGGSLTVAVLHRELLDKRRWISDDNFTLCFGLARLTPGTNVLAFCTGVGWLVGCVDRAVGVLDPLHDHGCGRDGVV
jgi:hypothetical protein